MIDMQANDFWLIPLNSTFTMAMVLIGIYSLIYNVADAKRRNHPSAERVARFGGWCYIVIGLGIHITRKFFTS